jgi:hypothetical protein
MQRQANWNPVVVSSAVVSSADLGTEGQTQVALPARSAVEVSPPLPDWQHHRRSDLRFSIGVAIALALPAVIALGFYEVAEAVILRG